MKNKEIELENRIPVTARGGDVRVYPEKSN